MEIETFFKQYILIVVSPQLLPDPPYFTLIKIHKLFSLSLKYK